MNLKPINGHVLLEIIPIEKKATVLLVNAKQEIKLRIENLGDSPRCGYKVGDLVRIEKYKGHEVELSDKRFMIINHKDIIAYESSQE